jgi:predicted ribosomally synthesized peptide with nif11-like leader
MPTSNVVAFYDKVVADPALQERLKSALVGLSSAEPGKIASAVVRLGHEVGHELTIDEVEAAVRETSQSVADGTVLTEEQLASVAGGVTNQGYADQARPLMTDETGLRPR